MKFNPINILWCAAFIAAASSCSDEDYKVYDTAQKDSVFFEYRNANNELVDTVSYDFNYDIATSHTIEIPVTLMGMPKDYDRQISIVTVPDSTNMTDGVNYTISDNIIPAGKVSGTVRINLIRDKDPEILEMSKRLYLVIDENEDLKSVGDNHFSIRYSDVRPTTRPAWWSAWYTLGYSFESAQLFFQYFYELAPKADINLYNEMIETYDHYFVKGTSVRGPLVMYEKFIRNYILIPLYRDHPELPWNGSPEW